jgi:protein TonB
VTARRIALALLAAAVAAPPDARPAPPQGGRRESRPTRSEPEASEGDRLPGVRSAAVMEDAAPRGPSFAERVDAIRARVQAALVYPPLARRRRVEGTSLVAFEVGADGLARGVAIAASSGSEQLDRAAARAVHDAGKLPYVYGRLEIPVRFRLEGRPLASP